MSQNKQVILHTVYMTAAQFTNLWIQVPGLQYFSNLSWGARKHLKNLPYLQQVVSYFNYRNYNTYSKLIHNVCPHLFLTLLSKYI